MRETGWVYALGGASPRSVFVDVSAVTRSHWVVIRNETGFLECGPRKRAGAPNRHGTKDSPADVAAGKETRDDDAKPG